MSNDSPNPNAEPTLSATPPSDGTIDVTNTVEMLRQSFVTWGVAYIYGLEIAIPGMEWVALPILSDIDQFIIKEILNLLTKSVVMEAFFLNTAIKKASQAQDYIDAVTTKNNLPPTATPDEVQNAENFEMLAFRRFVMVGNPSGMQPETA